MTTCHQLGEFIVSFQHIETGINNILQLLANSDDEAILILINELEYAKRIKTADVLFARFIELQKGQDDSIKKEFHSLIVELGKLGSRRNDLVHSRYSYWTNQSGEKGLIREHSKLRGKDGIREESEEELLPESLTEDLKKIASAHEKLEKYRLKIIDLQYPEIQA